MFVRQIPVVCCEDAHGAVCTGAPKYVNTSAIITNPTNEPIIKAVIIVLEIASLIFANDMRLCFPGASI